MSDIIINGLNTLLQNIQKNTKKYTFFSSAHTSFSKIGHAIRTQSKTQQIQENQNNIGKSIYSGKKVVSTTIETTDRSQTQGD